jgi:hypothetical protein
MPSRDQTGLALFFADREESPELGPEEFVKLVGRNGGGPGKPARLDGKGLSNVAEHRIEIFGTSGVGTAPFSLMYPRWGPFSPTALPKDMCFSTDGSFFLTTGPRTGRGAGRPKFPMR